VICFMQVDIVPLLSLLLLLPLLLFVCFLTPLMFFFFFIIAVLFLTCPKQTSDLKFKNLLRRPKRAWNKITAMFCPMQLAMSHC